VREASRDVDFCPYCGSWWRSSVLFMRTVGICCERILSDFEMLESCARIWTTRLSPFSWAQYGASAVPAVPAVGKRYAPFARSEDWGAGRCRSPAAAVSLSGQKSLHHGRQSEQDGRFIRIMGFCRHRFAPDFETLESYARIRATRLSPFPDLVMLLEMVQHVLLA
jgi:hypothetical protein